METDQGVIDNDQTQLSYTMLRAPFDGVTGLLQVQIGNLIQPSNTEILFHPPYWVHAALWLPLIIVVTLGPLRPMKGLMIALQYHHKAAESRFGGEES